MKGDIIVTGNKSSRAMMRIRRIAIVFIIILTVVSSACSKPAAPLWPWPTIKSREVPLPAPAPWIGVLTYTEQTYQISVNVSQEFAIGMFVIKDSLAPSIRESHELEYIELIESRIVPYNPSTLNNYGTKWFLFKAIKTGNTEINFNAPLEYYKVFSISINPSIS